MPGIAHIFQRKPKKRTGKRREKQMRFLSQAVQLEEAVNPHIIRATMSMISLAILIFLLWASYTSIHEVARTPGEVVPHGYQQTVQHLEGGIIKAIYVNEGELVKNGQVMVVLQDTGVKDDLARLRSKQLSLAMTAEQYRAFLEERNPDFFQFEDATEEKIADQEAFFEGMREAREKEIQIVKTQLDEKNRSIQAIMNAHETATKNYLLTNEIYTRKKSLNNKGYISGIAILEEERRVNDLQGEIKRLDDQLIAIKSEISEYEQRLASLSAGHRDKVFEKLSQIEAEKEQNRELVRKLEERTERLKVRAPTSGIVKGLSVNTIGAVVQPGETLMEIVPFDKKLEVQVKISPQDIGHIETGQTVQIKFSSYDFSRYGFIQGTLERISASTFTGEKGERYYQGRIILDKNYVGDNPDNLILPGMTVMADVITGQKTILQYLLKPIQISLQTAFSER